jgi:hypothetical protein
MSLYLYNETQYSVADLAQVIREQLAEPYRFSDNLRTAAMYCPIVMTPAEWVAAAKLVGIHEGSARNRLNEVRKQQAEDTRILKELGL